MWITLWIRCELNCGLNCGLNFKFGEIKKNIEKTGESGERKED